MHRGLQTRNQCLTSSAWENISLYPALCKTLRNPDHPLSVRMGRYPYRLFQQQGPGSKEPGFQKRFNEQQTFSFVESGPGVGLAPRTWLLQLSIQKRRHVCKEPICHDSCSNKSLGAQQGHAGPSSSTAPCVIIHGELGGQSPKLVLTRPKKTSQSFTPQRSSRPLARRPAASMPVLALVSCAHHVLDLLSRKQQPTIPNLREKQVQTTKQIKQ